MKLHTQEEIICGELTIKLADYKWKDYGYAEFNDALIEILKPRLIQYQNKIHEEGTVATKERKVDFKKSIVAEAEEDKRLQGTKTYNDRYYDRMAVLNSFSSDIADWHRAQIIK